MARDDPYRTMTLVFGVLLVIALVALYLVMSRAGGSASSIPPGGAYTGNGLNLTGNTPMQNSVISLANTTENRSLLHLAKLAAANGSNSSVMQVTIAPGMCAPPAIYAGANLSIGEARASASAYYLVTANATQETFAQMPATDVGPPLSLSSQNFTAVNSLRVPAGSQFFFCNPSQQRDTVTYAITRYG